MATNDAAGADRAKQQGKPASPPSGTVGQGLATGAQAQERSKQPPPDGTVGQGLVTGAQAKERSKQAQTPAAGQGTTGGGASGQRGVGTVSYTGGPQGMPEQFGRYRVVKRLGGGGMGAVFLVENTELKREEALKVPHFEVGADPLVRERFLREARSAAQLDHPNLCPVFDVGVHDGVCYLTMRYLKGKLLSDYAGTPQPPRKAVEIVTKLAQALGSAHGKGVIHRDLKPNNVMMCAGVGPVVMDFGLAKQTRLEDQKLTQSGTTLGTPAYMPPEQVTGDLERIGPATDVYSLGVILYELLTGRLPFKGATAGEIYGKILHTTAPPPSTLRAGLNPALDAVCLRAMAKAPESRYASMKDFAAALIEYLKATPPAEDAGALTATKTGSPPAVAAPATAPVHGAAVTQKAVKAISAVRPPAATQRPNPRPRTRPVGQERGGVSAAGVLGWFVLVLLMLGALGGLGYLIYTLNQKKATPSPDVVLAAQPASSSDSGKPDPTPVPKPDPTPPKPDPTPPKPDPTPPKPDPTPPKPDPTPPKPDPTPPPKPDPTPPPKPDPTPPPKPDEPDPTVLLNEDFKEVDVGGRPKDWDGDNFAVQKENDRPCLEVTSPSGLHYVTLPKVTVKGDFVMDCEFLLAHRHEFHLELGSRSSTPLTILVDWGGGVRIDQAEPKQTEGFKAYTSIRFRLKRKGDVYNVSINDTVTAGLTLPGKGTFDEVRIGLLGGKGGYQYEVLARLYSVKITSLEKPPPPGKETHDTTPPPPLPGVREDFSKVTAGSLPDGWTASAAGNLAVQKSGDLADLELTNTALLADGVVLPKVDLKGDFFTDVEAVFPDQDTAVQLYFKGTKVAPLVLELDAGGTIIVDAKLKLDGSKAWINDKANVLRLERSGAGYVIKLNGAAVGAALPLTVAPGPFKEVDLALLIKEKRKSPRVMAVRVQPLEAPGP